MAVLTNDNWRSAVRHALASLPDDIRLHVKEPNDQGDEMLVLITRPPLPGKQSQLEIELVAVRYWPQAREMYEANIAAVHELIGAESPWAEVTDFIDWLRQRLAEEEQAGTALHPVVAVGWPQFSEPPYRLTVGRGSVEALENEVQLFVLESLNRDSQKTGVYKTPRGHYVREDGTFYLPWQAGDE